MRWIALFVGLAALCLAPAAGAEEPPKKPKAEPPPVGIWWEKDFKKGMQRAAREGRPMLFYVNALETESANQRLGLTTYRSAPWGLASRGFVNFVCNPNEHGTGACSRYERHVCKGHREALTWFLGRFGQNLISPQHVILEPDGDVAFRKEYYTGVVSPSLIENYLSKTSPETAFARAGIGREKKIKAAGSLPLPELDAFAKTWLAGTDGLAAAAMMNALEDSYDKERRVALIRAMRHTHDLQSEVLAFFAEERMLYPGDEPEETFAWLETLFAVDRKLGVWGATRALVRMEDVSERDRVLRIWAGEALAKKSAPIVIGELPASERPFAYEALLLAKDRRAMKAKVPADWMEGRTSQVARARRKAGTITGAPQVDIPALLKEAHPGKLRAGLLGAPREALAPHADAIAKAMTRWRPLRMRVIGALALLKARAAKHADLAAETLWLGVTDLVEGESTAKALGPDRGDSAAARAAGRERFVQGLRELMIMEGK